MARKTASILALISFLMLVVSSVALYIIPGGRGATPEQLIMLGIHKMTWKEIHITGGFLFACTAIWHTVLNLRSLVAYIRKSATRDWKNVAPLATALLVTVFVYAGTVYGLEPMNTVLTAPKQLAAAHSQALSGGTLTAFPGVIASANQDQR